jgi:hypothetical protein
MRVVVLVGAVEPEARPEGKGGNTDKEEWRNASGASCTAPEWDAGAAAVKVSAAEAAGRSAACRRLTAYVGVGASIGGARPGARS